MYTKAIAMLTLIQSLMGCAVQAMGSLQGGENAAYSVRNYAPFDIEQARVVDASNSDRWYDSASALPANLWKPSAMYPQKMPGFGGNQYMSDTGHRVPEAVLVTWRELPAAGRPPYTGTLHGPHKVQIRERIPKEILAMAKKRGMTVQISLTAGQLPITFNWMLSEYQSVTGTGRGVRNHCIGGDSFTDPNLKSIQTGVDYRAGEAFDVYTPVWPNCKLP